MFGILTPTSYWSKECGSDKNPPLFKYVISMVTGLDVFITCVKCGQMWKVKKFNLSPNCAVLLVQAAKFSVQPELSSAVYTETSMRP